MSEAFAKMESGASLNSLSAFPPDVPNSTHRSTVSLCRRSQDLLESFLATREQPWLFQT